MNQKEFVTSMMLYTPEKHIPIAEFGITADGQHCNKLKKHRSSETEIISFHDFIMLSANAIHVLDHKVPLDENLCQK